MNDAMVQPNKKKKSIKILDALNLNALGHADHVNYTLELQPCVYLEEVAAHKRIGVYGIESFVGNADTARLFERILGIEVAVNRAAVKLERGDAVLVGQRSGPPLPEGATELPQDAEIKWWWVFLR